MADLVLVMMLLVTPLGLGYLIGFGHGREHGRAEAWAPGVSDVLIRLRLVQREDRPLPRHRNLRVVPDHRPFDWNGHGA